MTTAHLSQVLFVGKDRAVQTLVGEATRAAFPAATCETLPLVDDALARIALLPHELLVLLEPKPADLQRAREALDGGGLPRWPVVVLADTETNESDVLGKSDWNARTLARLFICAAQRHQLVRENARLRGDLRTISRRVSHDLRSPLNGIVTACQVLKEMLETDAPEDVEMLQPITDSADEITKLIEQVSFLAKVTTSVPPMETTPMDEVVWKALSRLERQIAESGATVTHAPTWPTVRGIAPWLENVWASMVGNSLKYAGRQPKVALGWDENGIEYRFWIEDGGPGVAAAKRAALFGPFHRLHEPNSARGFGLPIVQRLVDLQGGRCGYEERPEGGARFYFTLPR